MAVMVSHAECLSVKDRAEFQSTGVACRCLFGRARMSRPSASLRVPAEAAGAGSGLAWGWCGGPRRALAHPPVLVTGLDFGEVEGIEEELDAAADEHGVDFEGVAVQS